MEKLVFFWFLLVQASAWGWGIFAIALTCLVLTVPDRNQLMRLYILPAIWLLPLVVTAAFHEGDVKSADWIQHLFYPLLAVYVVASIWVYATLPTRRGLAAVYTLIHAPFCLLTSMIITMSSSGTWL